VEDARDRGRRDLDVGVQVREVAIAPRGSRRRERVEHLRDDRLAHAAAAGHAS
jgi:hypothetical protein